METQDHQERAYVWDIYSHIGVCGNVRVEDVAQRFLQAASLRTVQAKKALQDAYQAGRRDNAKDLSDQAADLKWFHKRRLHLEGEKHALQRFLGGAGFTAGVGGEVGP